MEQTFVTDQDNALIFTRGSAASWRRSPTR